MNTAVETSHVRAAMDRDLPEATPLAELVGKLSDDLRLLTRQEAELAKRELSESFEQAKRRVAQMALGGGVLSAGVLVLLAASVLALATVMPAWSAALLVGGLLVVLGVVLVLVGRSQLSRVNFTPQRTLDSVESDIAAIKQAVK